MADIAKKAGFPSFGHAFLAKLQYIPNQHMTDCNTICDIIENDGMQDMIRKNKWFQSYTKQFSHSIVINKMKKVALNKQLQIKARNVNPEFFNTFFLSPLIKSIEKMHH